jgi:Zn-dependent protease
LTALGMQALFVNVVGRLTSPSPLTDYAAQFLALVLGGYVAGHLVGRWHALYGALAAVLYIFVTVTISSVREVAVARQLGLAALPPIDFLQLAFTDIVAMTAASCGGWLAARLE